MSNKQFTFSDYTRCVHDIDLKVRHVDHAVAEDLRSFGFVYKKMGIGMNFSYAIRENLRDELLTFIEAMKCL